MNSKVIFIPGNSGGSPRRDNWFKNHLTTSATPASNITCEFSKKKLSGFEILGDLVGSVKNAPRDLSSNLKYLIGYGKEGI